MARKGNELPATGTKTPRASLAQSETRVQTPAPAGAISTGLIPLNVLTGP